MLAKELIAPTWSGIDVREFGPYHESLAAAVALKTWSDPNFKAELLSNPAVVLEREMGLLLPGGQHIELIDKRLDEFIFVIPETPPAEALWHRYEQISGWWMLAHANWWWMTRRFGVEKVAAFLPALDVQIIGRLWNDTAWRAALIRDPRSTLEAELKATFPPSLKVRSIADTPEVVHLVLPPAPEAEDIDEAADHLAGLFALSHTWWHWLVYSRLLRPAIPGRVTGMVN